MLNVKVEEENGGDLAEAQDRARVEESNPKNAILYVVLVGFLQF